MISLAGLARKQISTVPVVSIILQLVVRYVEIQLKRVCFVWPLHLCRNKLVYLSTVLVHALSTMIPHVVLPRFEPGLPVPLTDANEKIDEKIWEALSTFLWWHKQSFSFNAILFLAWHLRKYNDMPESCQRVGAGFMCHRVRFCFIQQTKRAKVVETGLKCSVSDF